MNKWLLDSNQSSFVNAIRKNHFVIICNTASLINTVGIHPKTCPLTNSKTINNHIIVRCHDRLM